MSILLEILGKGIEVEVADIIWHWLRQTSQSNQEDNQTDPIDEIVDLVAKKRIDSAEQHLRFYLFDNPDCVRGRIAAAAIYLSEGKLENAIEELNSIYMRQPSNTMALHGLGHCYERLLKEAEAVEFYQDCLKFKNYLRLPRQRLAAVYFKNGQVERAITEYELLKGEYPDDISSLVLLGHLYIAVGKYEAAVDTFNTAILIHPDNFNGTEADIEQFIAARQFEDAMELIDDILAKQPDRADLYLKRGDILGMLGSTTEAVGQYEEALHVCPDCLEATIKLGTQYSQLDRKEEAARLFNRALEINDQLVEAYIGLALAYKLTGQSDQAMSTLSLAAAIAPNSSVLFTETASLRFQLSLGESSLPQQVDHLIEAVIAAHKQQMKTNPCNPDIYYRLGILMMNVNRCSEAVKLFRRALELNPTFSRARTKLSICLFETNEKTEAIEQLAAAEYISKENLQLHYKTALLYCDKIKFASSLLDLDHTLNSNYASSEATENISIILQNLGLLDRVTAMWDNLSATAEQAINSDIDMPNL